MNTTFTDGDVAALLRIAGEVGELEADTQLRRAHILDRLIELVGGTTAVCSEMDPKHLGGSGWALPGTLTFGGNISADQKQLINRYLTGQVDALDPCIPTLLRTDKPVVTFRRVDVVDRSWYRSDHFNLVRRPLGFGESIYAKFVTPDGRRLKMSIHREMNDSPFTERDVQLIHTFNENLGRLFTARPRTQATAKSPAYSDLRITTMPPRLRPVLRQLLAGDAEKQVALKLGLSPHTVHEYTKALYKTFGVNSRGELLAQFVSGSPV